MNEIRFYRASEKPYGTFSNLYRRPVLFEGTEFETAEHAYQYAKPRSDAVRYWLMSAPSPALLAMAAHGLYQWDITPGWSKLKVERMRQVLLSKFTQHDDLRELLLSTGEARLVEAGTVDNEVNRFWGEVNGHGKNMLGQLLMETRAALRMLQPSQSSVPADTAELPDENGCWEVVPGENGVMYHVRWSIEGKYGYMWVAHYPDRHRAERTAEEFNRLGRRPWEWFCYKG